MLKAFIRDDGKFKEAPAWRQPMAVYDANGKGDIDYRDVLRELREREVAHVG